VQLRTARLCLDCEEIHDAPHCPICASDSFAFISRWLPAPERRAVARTPTAPSQAAVYQQLLTPSTDGQRAGRILKRSAIGAAVVIGLAGWLWRSKKSSDPGPARPPNSSV